MKENQPSIDYRYPSKYKVKSFFDQLKYLLELFPYLNGKTKTSFKDFSVNAEGLFLIPRWQTIARTYNGAIEVVFTKLRNKSHFFNYYDGHTGPENLRQTARTKKFVNEISESQNNNDILIFPAQFGIYHKGLPVHMIPNVLDEDEFCLDSFTVGIMLLTHPKRLHKYEDLRIDAAGDEYSPKGDSIFSRTPYFWFVNHDKSYSMRGIHQVSGTFGSATGFLIK